MVELTKHPSPSSSTIPSAVASASNTPALSNEIITLLQSIQAQLSQFGVRIDRFASDLQDIKISLAKSDAATEALFASTTHTVLLDMEIKDDNNRGTLFALYSQIETLSQELEDNGCYDLTLFFFSFISWIHVS